MDMDFGINAGFVEEIYAQYLENPESVDPTWRAYFESRGRGPEAHRAWHPATPHPSPPPHAMAGGERGKKADPRGNGAARAREMSERVETAFAETPGKSPSPGEQAVLAQAAIQARVYQLLNAYRVRGHLYADLDPLSPQPPERAELDLSNFGLHAGDIDKPFPTIDLAGPDVMTLREIIERLEETYCRSIGVEFSQIEDAEARTWLQERMESSRNRLTLTPDLQISLLTKLSDAEIFEQFIHGSYGAGTKRFSLEGAESLIPLLDLLVDRAGAGGVKEIVLGMAHRGRLNVLVNILQKSPREIFAAFEDADAELHRGGGDVKYHLGYSTDRKTASGNSVHVTMSFNPSHLEFVNPVVTGRVRAKQQRDGRGFSKVMPLLIHGDAAFIGQGVVAETLNLMNIDGYGVGGTIHVIVNNQIGFTTDPRESRSTRYASDITRMLKVPVFHVNGEDPEAVAQVALLAIDYRQRFNTDVIIDMYCYRRYGHNEGDEPRYTQPRMYAAIDAKPTVRKVYVKRLVELGHITDKKADDIMLTRREALADALREVQQRGFTQVTYTMGGVWSEYRGGADRLVPDVSTAVSKEKLAELADRLLSFPDGFKVHPKVLPILKARRDRIVEAKEFDWGTAETMAYATLLDEGSPVRISGQDVRRGTFSHRHAVVLDIETGEPFTPLTRCIKPPATVEIYNSPLSEAGVLGFEYGYALDAPHALVIWEAQFGDFLNGAQVIVDQFITSSEDKWHRLSGIVLFLPHGFEGQGPEHSSARLERFLQNSAEDNIQVCNLTTPAQLFHALRRQVRRHWRKPLIIMTPKSLLRVAATSKGPHRPVSTVDDLAHGEFQRVLPDTLGVEPTSIRKILLCTGKVYYDLAIAREARGIRDVAIVRLEQLYPLREDLPQVLQGYRDGIPLVWVQEEPLNYGAWFYINAYIPTLIQQRFPLTCVARDPSASPATGSRASHLLEQKLLIDEAFSLR